MAYAMEEKNQRLDMPVAYNAVMKAASSLMSLIVKTRLDRFFHNKMVRFMRGQQGLLENIQNEMAGETREVWWIHMSSLGEWGVARPIIHLLANPGRCIVVTFFSPSGYEVIKARKDKMPDVDHVFYLPFDTRKNARAFLDILQPQRAVFIISEFWLNYLEELHRRKTPTFLVSAIVHENSYLLKWHGKPYRRAMRAFTTMMVLDEESRRCLASAGFTNTEVTGDPLFDNAITVSQAPFRDTILDRFCSGNKVVVAGSVSDDNDLKLVSEVANERSDLKFLVIPHEIDELNLSKMMRAFQGSTLRYTQCTDSTDVSQAQVLIVDTMGMLSRLYRYGQWAYVGGGFTPLLHSVIEPSVYGLPVAFGPYTNRKVTPTQMSAIGIGKSVRNSKEFGDWLRELETHPDKMEDIKKKAHEWSMANANATTRVADIIINGGGPHHG